MALSRVVSALLRRSDNSEFIASVLKEIHSVQGGSWINGVYVPSLPAAYGMILEAHINNKIPEFAVKNKKKESKKKEVTKLLASSNKVCPKCGSSDIVSNSGCFTCNSCGDSSCG